MDGEVSDTAIVVVSATATTPTTTSTIVVPTVSRLFISGEKKNYDRHHPNNIVTSLCL
jgi:hypothetical protein